jgi:FkbM family methyltransferase
MSVRSRESVAAKIPQPHLVETNGLHVEIFGIMYSLLGLKLRLLRAVGRNDLIWGRTRLIWKLEPPENVREYPFEVDFFGFRYPGNLKRFFDWSVYFLGAYSHHELLLLADVVAGVRGRASAPVVAWDIGANVGVHTLFLAGIADHVVAFEPLGAHADLIEEKVALNGLDTVDVHRLALGDSDTSKTLHHPDLETISNTGTASLFEDYNPSHNQQSTDVKVVHGDRYRAAFGLPAPSSSSLMSRDMNSRYSRGWRRPFVRRIPSF